MSSQRIDTVKVQDGKGGYVVKNRSDMTRDDVEYKEPAGKKSGTRSVSGEQSQQTDFNSMTKAEIQAHLDTQGVEYASSANKDELVKLAEEGAKK